jgi:hypothetical protein
MAAQVGDRIIVESQKVGRAAREGEILEIIEAFAVVGLVAGLVLYGTRYRVCWDDG